MPNLFANARTKGVIYEPEFEEIQKMMEVLRNERPVPCYAIQFSGGEPTIREDLPGIIELAGELGFLQIQVASNGVRLAESPEYCKRLKDADCRLYIFLLMELLQIPILKLEVLTPCR